MNLKNVKDLVTSKMARQVLLTQKHSPKILFVAGTLGVVGATVLACRATLKMDQVLENHEKHVSYISEEAGTEQISHEEADKQIAKVKMKTGLEIVKLYAPAVGLCALSIGALTGSHIILSNRNTATMAALTGLHTAYEEYRSRVRSEIENGEDFDRRFVSGTELVDVEEKTADGKTIKKKVETFTGRFGGSPYAVLFDEKSHKFSREPGRNASTIMMNQSYANDKLRANGHLFLNEVKDMLGLPRTPAGQVVGWVYRRDNEPKNGDNYVTFGVYDGDIERAEAFVDGQETCVWLDFNVDGEVYKLIG